MKKALKTVLVAICGLTVLTFGLCVIVTHSKAEQKTLCIGYAFACTGVSIFVCSGILNTKIKHGKTAH